MAGPPMQRLVFLVLAALVLLAPPVPAPAQQAAGAGGSAASPVRALHTADDVRNWEAVGRLDTGVSFCTATLIAPELVLTAAHCLFTREGRRLADADLSFSAGLRHGRAEAIRGVSRSVLPEGYVRQEDHVDMASVAQDIALLRLDRPVPLSRVRPIAPGAPAVPRSAVTLLSYGTDREAFPSIEEDCHVLSRQDAVQILSCHVVSGSSGAPVIALGSNGPEIVAVVSGRAEIDGQQVTVAVVTDTLVPGLVAGQTASGAGAPRAQGRSITMRRVGEGAAAREGMGARFLRP
jgi:V8-like Glu-specific endopeptidase